MHTELSQLTLDKLRAFASRRRMLIAVRGLCVGVVSLLIVMSLIAIADALFIIKSDRLRWGLSLGGYAVVALTVWLTCVRSLLRIPGPRELARLVEQAAPGLREDLISAVELGSPQSDARFDSPVFRALLQASVERRMSGVRVASLLPGGLIRGAAIAASATLICCVALLLVPDLKFANRLTRAFLPSAPVDRVSNVQVAILAPSPADALVPHNDAVQIIVELTGGEAEDVVVETFRSEEGREEERVELKPFGGARRFAGAVQLGREEVRYRVLAGDAVTRTYTIRTGPRPHPAAFRKTYRFPDYAGLDPREIEEKHGHLEAITGTTVDIEIETDQAVRSGELRFDEAVGAKEKLEPIALSRIDDRHWRVTVPVTRSTLYKVHILAHETGFDNAFDPPYEIKATPDQAPTLTVESPVKDLLLPPGAAVALKLAAADDLGLAAVSQAVRINGGAWVEKPLAQKPGRQWAFDETWDLYDLNLRPGDQVTTRFSAADGAGTKTDSTPVHITITTSGLQGERLAGIEAKRRVLSALDALRVAAEEAARSAERLVEARDVNAVDRQRLEQTAAQHAQRAAEAASECDAVIRTAIGVSDTGSAAAELVSLAMAVQAVRDGFVVPQIPRQVEGGSDAVAACRALHSSFSAIVAADEADILLRDLMTLAQEHAEIDIAGSPADAASLQRLARRQLLIAKQSKQCESLAAALAPRLKHGEQIHTALEPVKQAAAAAEKALTNPTKEALAAQAQRMTDSLAGAKAALLKIASAADRETIAARRSLMASTWTLRSALDAHVSALAAHSADDAVSAALWKATRQRVKSGGSLHEIPADSNSILVADIGLLARALSGIEARVAAEPHDDVQRRLDRVAAAFRTLEAGHGVTWLHDAATRQASAEKWQRDLRQTLTQHPREWSWWMPRLGQAVTDLDEASHSAEAVDLLRSVSRSGPALIVDTEMASRRLRGKETQRRSAQLEQVAARLDEVRKLIAADMAKARAVIAAEAPTLPQLMAKLAEEARQLAAKAKDAAAAAEPAKAAEAAKELAAKQDALEAKLEELGDALRHEANAQDVMTDEGRERARDADDAAAMVRLPAEKAGEAIDRAAAAKNDEQRRDDLEMAAGQEAKLGDTLEKLAEHFKNVEDGKAEETRSALREAERELGIKREMDAEFGRMERLADLANKPAAEQMAALEAELKQNEAMQAELSEIAKAAAADAKESLEQAAEQERSVGDELEAAQKMAKQDRPKVGERMNAISRQAASLAQKVPTMAQAAKTGTAKEAADAAAKAFESLNEAANVPPPQDPDDEKAAAKQAKALAEAIREATDELREAEQKAQAAVNRLRDEESKATTTLAVGAASNEERQKAAETLLHAKRRQEASRKAASDAKAAAAKAQELAAAAEKLAAETGEAAGAGKEAIEEGLRQQPAIADAVKAAGEEVARAARHEARMNNKPAADALAKANRDIAERGAKQVERAAQELARASQPADAADDVEKAEEAIGAQAAELGEMLKNERGRSRSRGNGKEAGEAASRDAEAAKWMARALDELDRAGGAPKEGSSKVPPSLARNEKPGNSGEGQNPGGEKPGENGSGDAAQSAKNGGSPKNPGESSKPGGEGSESSANAAPGESSGEQASGGANRASQAVREAAQAQRQALAQARSGDGSSQQSQGGPQGSAMASSRPGGARPKGPGNQNGGESPGGEGQAQASAGGQGDQSTPGQGNSGNGNRGNAAETGVLPDLAAGRSGEWGKLPPKLARELMEGQRDEVPPEYRSQVEAYFRAIAQKAKAKANK